MTPIDAKYFQSRWSYIGSNRLSLRRAGCQTVLVEPAAPADVGGWGCNRLRRPRGISSPPGRRVVDLSVDWKSVFVPAIGIAEIIVRGSINR